MWGAKPPDPAVRRQLVARLERVGPIRLAAHSGREVRSERAERREPGERLALAVCNRPGAGLVRVGRVLLAAHWERAVPGRLVAHLARVGHKSPEVHPVRVARLELAASLVRVELS